MFQNTTNALQRGLGFGNPTESIEDVEETTLARQKLLNLENAKKDKQAALGYNYDLDLQTNLSNAVDAQVYTDKDTGERYQIQWSKDAQGNSIQTKVPFTGDTRNLYIDQTASGDYKLGLAAKSFNSRYNPNDPISKEIAAKSGKPYGWEPGPLGVTPQDGALMDIALPKNYATAFEYGVHSNPEMIKNRSIGVGPKSSASEALYGSGQTEYTTPNAPMWNADYIGSANRITADTPLPSMPVYRDETSELPVYEKPVKSSVGNTAKASIAGLLNTSSRLAELIGDSLETAGKWQDRYNKSNPPIEGDGVSKTIWGVQDSIAKWAMEEGKQLVNEQRKARETGMFDKLVGYDPREVQQYGAKFADRVEQGKYLEAVGGLVDPAGITAFVNSGAEMLIMANPVGLGTIMAANANSNLNNLEENAVKKGITLTNEDKALSVGLSVVGTYLDRLGDKVVLGKGLPALGKTLDGMPPEIASKVMKAYKDPLIRAATAVGAVAPKAGFEGSTEWMQTVMENKASDAALQNFSLTDKERRQALEAFGVGMGAGGVPATYNAVNEVNTAIKKDIVTKRVEKGAGEMMSDAQKEYADSLKTEGRELNEKGEVILTDEELGVFGSLKDVEPEAVVEETVVAPEAEDMFTRAESTKAKIDELVAQRDAISSKDPEARAEIEVVIGKLDEELSGQKAEIEEYLLNSSVEANTQKMVEQGATEEDIQASNEELKQSIIRMRGIAPNVLTKEDRAAGLTIEVARPTGVRLAEKGGKKATTFDSYDVKDETIKEIVSGGFTKETAQSILKGVKSSKITEGLVKHFNPGSDTVKGLESIQKSINETLKTEVGRKSLGNLIDTNTDMTEEKAMRMVALALAQVKSNITSEYHVNKNAGLKPKAEHARVDDVVQQLGKEYLNSYGLKYAGKAGPLAKKNAEIGRQILEFAQAAGLVKISKAEVSAREVVYPSGKNKGKPIPAADLGTYMDVVGKEINVNGQPVQMVATDVVTLSDNIGKKGAVNSEKANAATILSRLLKPTNQELPTETPVEEVPYNEQGEPLSELEEGIVKNMNAMKFRIKPEALALLREIKGIIYGPDGTGNFDTGSKDHRVKVLMDLLGVKADVNKEKDSGRSLNKTNALRNILDNLDVLDPDNMYYNYESAINRRIHVMQTILDFQGDKYMARNILTGGEYTTDTKAEADLLKEVVAEELFGNASKETIEALTQVWDEKTGKGNKLIDAAVRVLNSDKDIKLDQLLRVSKHLKMNNPFKVLNLLQAVADIRNGKGNRITSHYMVGIDASASGVTNTLLNRAGEPSIQAILQKMTIMGGNMDPYAIVNEAVQEIGDYDEIVKPVLQKFSKIYGNSKEAYDKALRTIAKYPVMTWFYGSASTNVATLMAEDITLEVIEKAIDGNKEAIAIVNEITGTTYNTTTITELTDQDILSMKKFYRENVGEIYANHMEKVFPGVVTYKKTMGNIFDILKESGQWKGLMPTAMAAMEAAMSKNSKLATENKMSIRKRKQTVEILGDNNAQQMLSEMFDNRNSMAVNPQHSTDSALLLLAMKHVMDKYGIDMTGIMTVHDATYGNPKILLDIKAEYDRLTVEMAVNYDYVAAGISEAREAISKVENAAEKRSLTARLDEIEARNKPLQEAKVEFLKDKKVSVLEGAKPVEPKTPKEEKTQEEVKPEVKPEEKTVPAKKEVPILNALMVATNQIAAGNGYDKLVALIRSLKVSDVNQKVKDKILSALSPDEKTDVKVGIKVSTVYGSLPGEVLIGRDIKDKRFSKKGEAFTADSLIETIGHEIDHAYNWSYIESEKGKNSPEVKYLKRALKKLMDIPLDKLSPNAIKRIGYIKSKMNEESVEADQRENNALAEMISILNNEGETAAEILGAFPSSIVSKTIEMVKRLIQDIADYIALMTATERENIFKEVTTEGILVALKQLEDATMVQTALEIKTIETDGKPRNVTSNNPAQDKVLLDAYLNPAKYADGVIARTNGYMSSILIILSGIVVDMTAPALRAAHIKAKRKSSAYTEVTNLLYTGFITSEIAQKMRSTIGVARHIDTSVLNEALSIADDINQKTKTILTTKLTDLKNSINKTYPKKEDQVRIYRMFARTGISGIQYDKEILSGIVNGTMTVEEALEKATKGMDADKLGRAEALAHYYVTGETKDNKTSPYAAGLYDMQDKLAVGLIAMSKIEGASKMLKDMPLELRQTLIAHTVDIQALNDEINMRQPGYDGEFHTTMPKFDIDYDGHYMKDVYNDKYEYKMVTREEMRSSLYTSENDWIVIKEVNSDNVGIVARKRIGESRTPGIGLNINKFSNGFHMTEEDSIRLNQKLEGMSERNAKAYLERNNIQRDSSGNRFRFILDEKTKVEKLGMHQDAAESLMRTYAHNVELVQMQAVRNLILEKATKKVNKGTIEDLNKDIEYNYKKSRKEKARELPMFLTLDYDYKSYDSLPKWVKLEYRTPDSLSTYNNFNRKVQLVRKGEADILLGHKNFSFFGGTDARTAAKWEQGFKELVVMAKQKMVVASASKLAVDTLSNMGVLMAKDVSLWDIKKYMPEAFSEYMDFSKKRTEIVELEMKARMGEKGAKTRLDKANEGLKSHKFYKSFRHGFVQSYSTSLVTQDFDTLSGLQHHIDELVESMTKDKKGRPNEIYDAIKWWQRLGNEKGIGVDHLLNWASEISKVKGTNLSTEMKNMAKRLKDKKDVDSVARYVGDIIGSPASELVTLGGAYMVTVDAASKYTLVQSLLHKVNPKTGETYTEEDAYMEANETFIDYRQNMPAEIKALSDYGVLLFPSFWIKAQKVIAGMVMYHPATAVGGYAIADFLDVNSANFIDVNIANRAMDGRILNDPTSLIDWDILSPWL